jgi:hypothetical protein
MVTDMNGKSDSDLIQPGAGWSYTFYNEGKYTYYYIIPPWLKGLVIVTCFSIYCNFNFQKILVTNDENLVLILLY